MRLKFKLRNGSAKADVAKGIKVALKCPKFSTTAPFTEL